MRESPVPLHAGHHHAGVITAVNPTARSTGILQTLVRTKTAALQLGFSRNDRSSRRHDVQLVQRVSFRLGRPINVLRSLRNPGVHLNGFRRKTVRLTGNSAFILADRPVLNARRQTYIACSGLTRRIPSNSAVLLSSNGIRVIISQISLTGRRLRYQIIINNVLSGGGKIGFPKMCLSVGTLASGSQRSLVFNLGRNIS